MGPNSFLFSKPYIQMGHLHYKESTPHISIYICIYVPAWMAVTMCVILLAAYCGSTLQYLRLFLYPLPPRFCLVIFFLSHLTPPHCFFFRTTIKQSKASV